MIPALLNEEKEDQAGGIVIEEVEKDDDQEDSEIGIDAAVTDMMSALKTDDKDSFKSALKSFIYFSQE